MGSNSSRRGSIAGSMLLLLSFSWLMASCCAPTYDVWIGPPVVRWDHNRTVLITEWQSFVENPFSDDEMACEEIVLSTGDLVSDRMSTPYGEREGHLWTGAPPRGGPVGSDDLPAAWLRAGFVGGELPLSRDSPVGGSRSDYDDLAAFLAKGPFAQVGLEDDGLLGALPGSSEYALVLDFLSRPDELSRRQSIEDWAEEHDLETTRSIFDGRFLASSFVDRLAIRYRDFWFVLFMPDLESPRFSRLVVVPDPEATREPADGEPNGGSDR